ncbi:serine hydrolase domain-containing protein [Novosphingobium sp. Gsoil 351]|uniref:serine hydrolase domain-containing protein n=1 Tax=Novosphingobium sp. Gsoil 351 TaxID=2675225 RepID=UPI0012B497B0|nr:serine hydrolase domain-containing protein [Novosphingobium sp. Gsoil 351]QGN55694.1 serine hydrolase [Novosphingobium sp. Gsoil 351]
MIEGFVAQGFEAVRDAFAANFERPLAYREVGASLAVYRCSECVVDLWGGHRDREGSVPWTRDTLVNLWSTTKGIAAICVAILVDRGRLRYEDRVADHWPEFAAQGKAEITVAQLLSHQAGLPGFVEPTSVDELFDQPLCADRLARQAPLWEPGTVNGYHAATWGTLVAEIVRRVDGRTLGQFLPDELAGPAQADFWLGLPQNLAARVADIIPSQEPVDLDTLDMNPAMQLALASPQLDPIRANAPDWRSAELPALNGHGSAQGIARIYAAALSGAVLSEQTLEAMTAIAADRTDQVLGFNPQWAMGLMVNGSSAMGPARAAFGHGGWGGSVGCADRESGIAMGYAPNHMGADLVGDPRAISLCHAVFGCASAA